MIERNPFDPFDPKHGCSVKRRKSREVLFDRRQWIERVDRHFSRAMESLGWPEFVQSNWVTTAINDHEGTNIPVNALYRNFVSAMERCGYVKVENPDAKDGRWEDCGERFSVYGKSGLAVVDRAALSDALGW